MCRRLRVDSSFFATAIEILLWKEFKDKLFGPMEHRSWPCIMFRPVFFFFLWIKFATILSENFFQLLVEFSRMCNNTSSGFQNTQTG